MPLERQRPYEPARDQAYSEWHRPESISRFMDRKDACWLSKMDLDSVEIQANGGIPVALIETTEIDVNEKNSKWTQTLAELSGLPAYVVQTVLSESRNPACKWVVLDIERFVVKRLEDGEIREMTPQGYACWLRSLRDRPRLRKAA